MADWRDVRAIVQERFGPSVRVDDEFRIDLLFGLPGGGEQQVWLSRIDGEITGWVTIQAPVAFMGEIDLLSALELMEQAACGGLCQISVDGERLLVIRHSVPLANMGIKDLEIPLHDCALIAADLADHLGRAQSDIGNGTG